MLHLDRHREFRPNGAQGSVDVVHIPKGGAAKTTFAVLYMEVLTRLHKRRVALVDLDEQANLTNRLGVDPDDVLGINTVLENPKHGAYDAQVAVDSALLSVKRLRIPQHVGLLAGSPWLSGVLAHNRADISAGKSMPNTENRLRAVFDVLRPYFDTIIVDTPPLLSGEVIDGALLGADRVIIPVMDSDCLSGVARFLQRAQFITNIRNGAPRARPEVYFVCPHYIRATATEVDEQERASWLQVMAEFFPDHWIPEVLPHSIQLPRGRDAQSVYSALGQDQRGACRAMIDGLMARQMTGVPDLLGAVLDGRFPMLDFEWRAHLAADTSVEIRRGRLTRSADAA